ncbi:hypothetical protein [Shewanella aestuarii]|uniref:Uncharacterized protein n=1 Tax=Shewanella aestuarii TaxID=1028752 RepID=A0A6G9QM35_9GAMM|nr:hypothetical protein [Shewanella aestuarii]QIR15125.1 hypothetical protein HBH39_12045 [Shewanella aestuarii]
MCKQKVKINTDNYFKEEFPMRSFPKLFFVTSICALSALLPLTAYCASGIVSSSTVLDIETGSKFDQAEMLISGPGDFNQTITLYGDNTQIDIDDLGELPDGNYTYQIQYIQHGKTEYINDNKTGREGVPRNTGKIKTISGFFNVYESEFVTSDSIETESEFKDEQ